MNEEEIKVDQTGMYYQGKYYRIKAKILKVEKIE